jgi:hypothetical protein
VVEIGWGAGGSLDAWISVLPGWTADNLSSMLFLPVVGLTAGWILGQMLFGPQRVPAIDPSYLPGSSLRIILSPMTGLALGSIVWAASSLVQPGTKRRTILRLSVLASLGTFIGVALAFLLRGFDPGGATWTYATYVWWDTDTAPRFWTAVFYGAIGLGVAVAAGLWLRARGASHQARAWVSS